MQVYADNASSTPIRHEVISAMQESYEHYGNPSRAHALGQKSNELVENARNQIARSISAKPHEIIFTSGGTESNNLAIKGFVEANSDKGYHIITTQIEHLSVLNPIRYLWDSGYDVTYLPVDSDGRISIQQLMQSIRRNTILISIMFANNEIGTIQPIQEIGAISQKYNICFHTDAVQAFGHCDIDVNALGIDMMSISGHKIYASKGIGALYIRDNIDLLPILHGSGQEYSLRSGTENLTGIVGIGKAVECFDVSVEYLLNLKNKFISGITEKIPDVKINGSDGLPGIINISFPDVNVMTLFKMLDEKGIYISISRPHVLKAIGASNSLRFSFGKYNIESDIDYILELLPELVNELKRR